MASPKVTHGGFLVPNAGGLAYPRMAEVDQVDLNTVSQGRWAVVEGCQVNVSGTTAIVTAGTAIVNGKRVIVPGGSASLGVGGQQDRFDIVAVTASGGIRVIAGTPSFDPVLPDPGLEDTILAAVFCPTGSSSFVDNVIDKRVMAAKALISSSDSGGPSIQDLIQNFQGDTEVYNVKGDGRTTWTGDTVIYREAPETLRIINNLNLAGKLKAGQIEANTANISGLLDSKNIYMADTPKGDDPLGTIRQGTDGRLWVNTNEGWVEIATSRTAVPLGAIMTTVEPPDAMAAGWVALDGRSVTEQDEPTLFTLSKMQRFISGVIGARIMALPNMTNRVLIGTLDTPQLSGSPTATLTVSNLPPHKHDVKVLNGGGFTPTGKVGQGGGHGHGQSAAGGKHGHPVTDPGHAHDGMEGPGGTQAAVVALMWGGKNKLDALFNDRNHTYSVEAFLWTRRAVTGITIGSTGSEHTHLFDPAPNHDHPLTLNPTPEHPHSVTESNVGQAVPFSIRQEAFSVFMYIKS